MEFIKQLWQNSIWLRLVVIVAVAGLVLMVVTHGSSGPPASYDESANSAGGISGKIDEVKQRLPGNGLPSKIRRVTDKVVKVLDRSADDGVCRISKQQAPVGVSLVEGSGKLQLNTPDDFQWCAEKLKEEVFGHDDVIDAMAAQLKKTVLLRHHSKAKSGLPPLGVFFLAGAPGIGKRLLTTGFGRRLFRKGGVTVLNINDCTRDGSGVDGSTQGATYRPRLEKGRPHDNHRQFETRQKLQHAMHRRNRRHRCMAHL
ncbi:MAG: hypothetical protein V3R99_03505 [Thermoguttaceae bacterium]